MKKAVQLLQVTLKVGFVESTALNLKRNIKKISPFEITVKYLWVFYSSQFLLWQ